MDTQRNPPIGRALLVILGAAVATTAAMILLGFASSYVALADWAKENGDPGWVHHVWPLFLEGFVAVGSLFVLAAALRGLRAWYPLALVIVGNAGSIAFNVWRADTTPAKFTAAIPPIAALLAFELASRELYKALTGRTAPETLEDVEADTEQVLETLEAVEAWPVDLAGLCLKCWPTYGAHAPVVYFLRNGSRIKIGTSTHLAQRVRALSLSLDDVVLAVAGNYAIEGALHLYFREHRVAGSEWFEAGAPLLDFVREYQAECPQCGPDKTQVSPGVLPAAEKDDPPALEAAVDRTAGPVATAAKVPVRMDAKADRTQKFARSHPDMTQADVAKRLGMSERTVRRHLSAQAGATVVPLRSSPSGTG